ncbi:MAG: deoxyribonucleotide triphosphate pyrophosphatase [Candidatus Peribacteria bacterium]|nr:deoxyribonucleotide triphosphate pyrophosphatase [Candidatus Peribacteria bacterium]
MKESLAGFQMDILSPVDLGITNFPEEHGDTFEANALEKARFYFEQTAFRQAQCDSILADDSGIIVEALQNELGIHTRRWGAGKNATDREWIEYFLERMQKEENKRARFVCVLAFIDPLGEEHLFQGTCDGIITSTLEADYLPGLPISACFKPNGLDKVYSALGIEEKNSISHRGRAMQKLRDFLIKRDEKSTQTL